MPKTRKMICGALIIAVCATTSAMHQWAADESASAEGRLVAVAGRYHSRQRSSAFYYRSTEAFQQTGRLPKEMQRALR